MEVNLLLPLTIHDAADLFLSLEALDPSGESLCLTLHIQPSRVLWNTLQPLFFEWPLLLLSAATLLKLLQINKPICSDHLFHN